MRRWAIGLGLSLVLAAGSCGRDAVHRPVAHGVVGGIRVTLTSPDGHLERGTNHMRLVFENQQGLPKDVAVPAMTFTLPGQDPTAADSRIAVIHRVGVGVYAAEVDLDQGGLWQGRVTWTKDGQPQQWRFTSSIE